MSLPKLGKNSHIRFYKSMLQPDKSNATFPDQIFSILNPRLFSRSNALMVSKLRSFKSQNQNVTARSQVEGPLDFQSYILLCLSHHNYQIIFLFFTIIKYFFSLSQLSNNIPSYILHDWDGILIWSQVVCDNQNFFSRHF